jgi:flagellar export protein FliJ
MAKFKHRLEKLIEYRRLQEGWAKDAWMEAQAARIEGERARDQAWARYRREQRAMTGDPRAQMEQALYVDRLAGEAAAEEAALGVVISEEEIARRAWLQARQDAEALEKLREKAREEWRREQDRREQAELDELAVLRRAA